MYKNFSSKTVVVLYDVELICRINMNLPDSPAFDRETMTVDALDMITRFAAAKITGAVERESLN